MVKVGSEGLYEWLVSDQPFDLLQLCPDIALGKYIAITSFDSGPLYIECEISNWRIAVDREEADSVEVTPGLERTHRLGPRSTPLATELREVSNSRLFADAHLAPRPRYPVRGFPLASDAVIPLLRGFANFFPVEGRPIPIDRPTPV